MNVIKRFLSIALILAVIVGCKKDTFTDTSFVNGVTAPAKLSVMFDITQDNSGLVTIYPSGEGVSSYDVYYGDGTTTPATVAAGKNIQHKYAEGAYTVKVVAHNVSGKTTETTQALTVSFRAPENVKATVTTNGLTVTVSATAIYQTLFKVYYGDSLTVVPLHFQSVLQGGSVTHTYPAAGTYTIRVVALSGGAASTEVTQTVKVGKQIDLPVTFDDVNTDYTVSDFGNNSSSIVADPTNAANKVMKTIKPANAEVWSGTTIGTATGFATKIPVTVASSKMSIRVYSPAAGLDIKLKIEDHNDGTHAVETDVLTTVANQWETLTFDFNANAAGTPAFNAAYTYDKASVFFDYGKTGTARTFYADDLKMVATLLPMTLPVTFDAANVNYGVVDFGNNSTIDGIDPTNAANKVKITTKPNGAEVWAGTTIGPAIGFPTKIPFTATSTKMSIRVYSPAVGIHMRLKVEDHNDGSKSVETEAISTVANAWETLTFDFSAPASGTPAMNLAYNYDKASIFFDFNVAGNGKKFYWDDVTFLAPAAAVLGFPMDFESTSLNYAITDFNGGGLTVITNPKSSGINTSSRVAQMIKSNGEVYGGSFITLPAPIDFSTKKTFKVKVYSPRVGAKLLLKVENLTDGNTFYQAEVASTVANQWETLTFDYSAVPTNKSFQKLVFIFDNGTKGDGTANYTWLMDDITLN